MTWVDSEAHWSDAELEEAKRQDAMTYNNDVKKFMDGERDNVVYTANTPYDAMLNGDYNKAMRRIERRVESAEFEKRLVEADKELRKRKGYAAFMKECEDAMNKRIEQERELAPLDSPTFTGTPTPASMREDAITTTPTGMNQSKSEYKFDLIPPEALLAIARVFAEGYEKYDKKAKEEALYPDSIKPNWMNGTPRQHIGRVMAHLTLWLSGDRTEDHLAHAMVRCIMAYSVAQS